MLSNKTPLRHRYAMPPLPKERLSCILRTNSKLAKLGIVWYIRHRKDKEPKYSYKFKRQCVELYRQGKWPETPKDITGKNFHNTIRVWVRIEDKCGPEALRHKNQRKTWSAEEKYELVAKVLAGASNKETAISAGINAGLLYQWVRCYKIKGYQGLVAQRKGRPPKEPEMKKKIEPAELTPSEREEMILLRAENERLRAEIAIVKKEIALREERCAAQLKAKKLRSSKNCVKKVTN